MALSSLGVSGHRVEIGDLGIHHRLLESLELSERATAFIVGSLGELKTGEAGLSRIRERAIQLRLLVSDPQQRYISAAIAGMEEGEAGELLSSLLVWTEAGSLGQREPSEVVERLLRKFRGSDDPARLEKGLELAYSLAMVRGDPAYCLTEVATLIRSHGLDHGALEGLTEILELLDPDQLAGAEVVLDFGLARGLDYYTGIIFEIHSPRCRDLPRRRRKIR